jgi:ARID/BRIGHT DNA binding domain
VGLPAPFEKQQVGCLDDRALITVSRGLNASGVGAGALPKLGRKPLDMMALYREVGLRGGFQQVQEQKWWKRIGA